MSESEKSNCISSMYGRCIEVAEKNLDVWNHTNNVCYVQWMQDVAVEHSETLGWDAKRYLESGAIWVVRNHSIDYFRSTYKGDKLLIQTWIAEMKRVSCLRRYRFLELPKDCNLDELDHEIQLCDYNRFSFPKEALIATAETHWAFISTQNFRPVRVFDELIVDFKRIPNKDVCFPRFDNDKH